MKTPQIPASLSLAHLFCAAVLLCACTAPDATADNAPATHTGGLMCLSITPERYDGQPLPSCD
jgi:hypothetical protein